MIIYNEIDKFAAAWLRELIKAGMIAPGEVWENDIRDIRPIDLRGVVQFHGFAGIGVWSYAARRAGIPDTEPLWSMSCPCQPFSAAGAGAGFDDERHLWPHAHWLIQQCRPPRIVGEQVASKAADDWINLVQADLEALGYTFGAVPFPSASVGAPHIRDRTYWLADADGRVEDAELSAHPQQRLHGGEGLYVEETMRPAGTGVAVELGSRQDAGVLQGYSVAGGMAHAYGGNASTERQQRGGEQRQFSQDSGTSGLADYPGVELERLLQIADGRPSAGSERMPTGGRMYTSWVDDSGRPGPVNGFWRDADWLFCRDGKWRPVRCGTQPLVDGSPARVGHSSDIGEQVDVGTSEARVGRLRGYGNAINAQQATVFLEEVMGILNGAVEPTNP